MRSFGVTAPRLQPQPPFPGQRFGTGGSAADLFFCAVWLSSTSGSHAVATPNGRRTRPQQSRARRWRPHRPRQFSHPRIAVRIRQSPASLPAVVQPREGDWQAPLRPHRRHQRRTRVRAQHNSELSGNRGRRPDDAVRLEIGEQQFVASGRDETASMPAQVSRATRVVTARVRQQQRDRRRRCCRSGAC